MACSNLRFMGRTLWISLCVWMVFPAVPCFAQDAQIYRDEIRGYQVRLDEVKANFSDTQRVASELVQITSWIDEALILIGKKEVDKVKTLSLKIGVYLDFVDASLQRDLAMSEALEAESRLKALKAEHGKVEAQVQQLEAETVVLQEKLTALGK